MASEATDLESRRLIGEIAERYEALARHSRTAEAQANADAASIAHQRVELRQALDDYPSAAAAEPARDHRRDSLAARIFGGMSCE